MIRRSHQDQPIVVTGIGMSTSVGADREQTWRNVCAGVSGVRSLRGMAGIPDDLMIGATVESVEGLPGELKTIALCRTAALEAVSDAKLDLVGIDRDRVACAISGHFGDFPGFMACRLGGADEAAAIPWSDQMLPNSACWRIATELGLYGPRLCHSTACASGLIDILTAVRSIRDGQCDMALAGSAQALNPLLAAGFRKLRVLAEADDPREACRPFDRDRSGFVMGEGAAMFVIETLDHALDRGATIYAELCGGTMLAEAHHVTSLDENTENLVRLIETTMRRAELAPDEIGYINAHATGTQQNDLAEARGIRASFGRAANEICVGANKSSIGHLVNAAGSVELALTTLSVRDGYAPPTLNLRHLDPECDLDCVPLIGRTHRTDCALKISCAFGGHLVGVAVKRWNDAATGFGYPDVAPAKAA